MKRNLRSPFKHLLSAFVGAAVLSILGPQTMTAATSSDITTFVVGKTYLNLQDSADPPVPAPYPTYAFIATTVLATNRTASSITLSLASGGTSNLLQTIILPAEYLLFDYDTNNARFESIFPEGNYVFKVASSLSNQQVTATLPSTMPQPNAPHISNYSAAQTMDPTRAFTLMWDPFEGGTAADYIFVTVGNKAFQSPEPGTSGSLDGSATSLTIPAGKLVANSNYVAQIIFYHTAGTTNLAYTAGGYRATVTQFHINTIGTGSPLPLLSKPVWGSAGFSFDVTTSSTATWKVLYSTDCFLPVAQWQILLQTSSAGGSLHVTVPTQPLVQSVGFFRIQN